MDGNAGAEEDALLSNEGSDTNKKASNYLSRKPGLIVPNEIREEEHEDDEDVDVEDGAEDKRAIMNYDYKIVQSTRSGNFQCNMVEIHFETQNIDNPNPGYYVRLETVQDKQQGIVKIQKALKQSAFQFSFDSLNKRFCRELRDKENKEILLDKLYLQMKKMKESYLLK